MKCRYSRNVRFTCSKCGICCGDTKRRQRHILLLEKEAEKISVLVGQQVSEFAAEIEGGAPYVYEMRKTPKDGKCLFLKDKKCAIYSKRPIICRFYPFELRPARNWKHAFHHTDECPGLGSGRLLPEEYFQKLFQLARRSIEI